jgi:hypothetical protein
VGIVVPLGNERAWETGERRAIDESPKTKRVTEETIITVFLPRKRLTIEFNDSDTTN